MKKDLKNDLWRIYLLVYFAFVYFSTIKCVIDLFEDVRFLNEGVLFGITTIVHIGSYLLIFSGRLKDKD